MYLLSEWIFVTVICKVRVNTPEIGQTTSVTQLECFWEAIQTKVFANQKPIIYLWWASTDVAPARVPVVAGLVPVVLIMGARCSEQQPWRNFEEKDKVYCSQVLEGTQRA